MICSGVLCLSFPEYIHCYLFCILKMQPMSYGNLDRGYVLVILIQRFPALGLYLDQYLQYFVKRRNQYVSIIRCCCMGSFRRRRNIWCFSISSRTVSGLIVVCLYKKVGDQMVQFVGFGVGLAVCMLLDDQYTSKCNDYFSIRRNRYVTSIRIFSSCVCMGSLFDNCNSRINNISGDTGLV